MAMATRINFFPSKWVVVRASLWPAPLLLSLINAIGNLFFLVLVVFDGCLDGVFGQHGAVKLDWR